MILETYTRVFVDTDLIEGAIAFYKALLSGEESLRFRYPETGLELAAVSSPRLSVLIIAGPPEKRRLLRRRVSPSRSMLWNLS